jgi:hypothetical protein
LLNFIGCILRIVEIPRKIPSPPTEIVHYSDGFAAPAFSRLQQGAIRGTITVLLSKAGERRENRETETASVFQHTDHDCGTGFLACFYPG